MPRAVELLIIHAGRIHQLPDPGARALQAVAQPHEVLTLLQHEGRQAERISLEGH